jgi:hypothetical protein
MLRGIELDYQKQVASMLKWLAFSMRPLYLEELAEIYSLVHQNPMLFDENYRLFTLEDVLTYLPGLVMKVSIVIDDRRKSKNRKPATEIRFVPFSVKEYLCSSRIAQEQFLHQNRLHICIYRSLASHTTYY